MYQRYLTKLHQLEKEKNLRRLPGNLPVQWVNVSSNDYLGLNNDHALREEFSNSYSGKDLAFSAASSRLLTGNCKEYNNLESSIANAFQRETCLIFNSGYHANIGILPSLAGKRDLLVADKLVHASIIDGMRLSNAEILRYRHLDYEHLENILQKHRSNYEHVFIITESIFSMDGDRADLPRLVELKNKYKCFIYLDEAHAFGIYGQNGLGCAEESGCICECDFIVGTFGKALASVGAFVVCDHMIGQYLVNTCRSLLFTTALPPVNLAWTMFLFERLPLLKEKRKHLVQLSKDFSKQMGKAYLSHIIPFVTGSNEKAVSLTDKLRDNGIYVLPIRYPTVPKGQARLRFSLNAALSASQLQIIPEIIKLYEPTLGK